MVETVAGAAAGGTVVAVAVPNRRALAVVAVALVVPVLAALLERPQRGVLLLAALVPFDGLLLLVVHPALLAGWKEVLVLATTGAAFVHHRRGGERRPLPPWWPAAGGLLVLCAVSALLVGGWQAVIGLKVLGFYGLVAVAVWRCPLRADERDHLVTIIIAAGIATAAIGILQQVLGANRLHALGYEWDSTIRTTGGYLRTFSTFNQPFGFALFLVLVLLVGIPHAITEPRRIRSRVFVVCIPMIVLALATTFVRGAWIGLLVGIAYLGVTRWRPLLLIVPLAAVTFLVLPGSVSSAALDRASGAERVSAWRTKVGELASHPLGVGVGASGSAADKVALLEGGAASFQPDNFYYKIALELGPLGVWLFVLLLVSTYRTAHLMARSGGECSSFADSTAAMVAAAAAVSMVATYFEIFPMDVYFWLLVGVVSACRRDSS